MFTDAEVCAWLVAERDHQLGAARCTILDGEQVIGALREQVVEQAIDSGIREAGLDRRDVDNLIAALDRTKFVRLDGSVDTERVSAVVAQLHDADPQPTVERRPPPRSSSRTTNNGQGQGYYLQAVK